MIRISLTRPEAGAIHEIIVYFAHEAPVTDRMLLEGYKPQFATYATRGTPSGNMMELDDTLAMAVRRVISRNRHKLKGRTRDLLSVVYDYLCETMDSDVMPPIRWQCQCGNRNGPGMFRCGGCDGHYSDSEKQLALML